MKHPFLVTKPLAATFDDVACTPHTLGVGQEILAEYPVINSFGIVEFEQDNYVFRSSVQDFLDSTRLKYAEPETL
jgi:hypothetical protein